MVLDGMIVCFTDYGHHGKEKLENLAQELGAIVFMSPSRRCQFLLGSDRTEQNVQRIIRDGKHDVVSVEWLIGCEAHQSRIALKPRDYICRSTEAQHETTTPHFLKLWCGVVQAVHKITSLLVGEDPGTDLEAQDIEQIVEHHMNQETIRLRHRKDLAHRTVRCDELNMEELFPGSTALNSCRFYRMKLLDEPRTGSSSWPSSLRSEVMNRTRVLQSELDALAVEWKVMIISLGTYGLLSPFR